MDGQEGAVVRRREPRAGRDRMHVTAGRSRRINASFTAAEFAVIAAAARSVGLTPTGFCGESALGAAGQLRRLESVTAVRGVAVETLGALQAEMFDARTALNRVGTNLNQAIRELNSTGVAPVWLVEAAARCRAAVVRVDGVASAVDRALR